MDCCCLNRPFDDQSNPIVHLEAEAIKVILSLCEQGAITLISSQILKFEIERTPDILRREKLKSLEQLARSVIRIDKDIEKRAKYFEKLGLQSFDALHLAGAEKKSDIILTVDRKFLRNTKRIKDLKIEVKNPIDWIKEVFYERDN